MKFYTYISQIGNKIYVRDIDNKGQEYSETVSFKPTLYVPCPPEKSTFKTLDNKPLAPLKFPNIKECRDFVDQYSDVTNYPIYGNKNYGYQYITENYPEEIEWDASKLSIFTLDIEVASDDGFPDIRLAHSPITALTVHNSINDTYYVFGMGEYTSKDSEKIIKYFRCDNEEEMMYLFLDWWKDNPPHIVTGWNCKFFDIPYIVNRLKFLSLDYKLLSPIKRVYDKNVTIAGRDNMYYAIIGLSVLDYLDLYKKYTYKNRESYRLDYIGQVELGMGKITDEAVAGYDLYKTDYQKFIEYNIKDVEIVKKLDDKMKLLDLLITIAYESQINFEDVFSPVRTWECIIYNFLRKNKIAIPTKRKHGINRTIEGGYVKDPHIGLHEWVVSFDLNSLYPHLIQQYNISPETISDDESLLKYAGGVDGLLHKKYNTSYLKDHQVTLTPNGQHFTTKFQGFLPKLMKTMYDDRVTYKKKMLDEEQRLEDGNYKNKQDVVNNISKYNNAQMAKKILLNSAYGALANQYFLYYSPEQAEAITMSGQLSIRWIERCINRFINDLLKTEGTDYVIASDTDSVYITFDKIVNEICRQGLETEKVISILDKICKDKIEPFIDNCYKDLHAYVNSYEQKMVMKRESIADKGIWTAKKRYILNVYDSEGVRYKEPKLKIMGIESVRSSTPQWCRENIQSLIKTIINTDEKTVIKIIEDYRGEFKKLSFSEIAFPRSVRGLSKYKSSKDIYIKATPIHVRGTLLYNHQLRERKLTKKYQLIRDGEKIKFAYLKEPNILGENVIAIATVLPTEFDLERFIDYDLQFDKSFLQPIKNILDAIGWKSEKISTLESFFG